MITRLNPDTLPKNPAFSQVAVIHPAATLVFVGGQNAVNTQGEIVGHDLASQMEQAIKNLIAALAAAGATLKDVFKVTIYVVAGQSLQAGFAAVQPLWDIRAHPPTISGIFVAGLARPEFLVEIEAVAAIQTGGQS
ncbi:MAG TPA: RidA family protein [Phototrophicaceae bacterium]|nr:RidA family protein [Phototrophicaceae bacterium]